MSVENGQSPKSRKALIIGYGNPLRSDDGFGWHAGRLLAQALAGQEAEVITCHQLTPELADGFGENPELADI